MGTMSPDAPRKEINGMLAAERYANKRPNLSGVELREIANRLWQHYAVDLGKADFANGLREGLFIISRTRH